MVEATEMIENENLLPNKEFVEALARRIKEECLVGRIIRELREQKGLAQLEVASKAGMDASGLNHIERGYKTHRDPRISTVLRLLYATGCSFHEFANRVEDFINSEQHQPT